MAYLEINGITVKVQGGEVSRVETGGGRGFSANGVPNISRNRSLRKWRFVTPPMAGADSLALMAMLNHECDAWRFAPASRLGIDDTEATSYSDRGLAATSPVFAVHGRDAADGSRVFRFADSTTIEPITPYVGCAGAVAVEASTANLIATAAVAECSDTGSFSTFGTCTLSLVTAFRWQGANCLGVTNTSGTTMGANASNVTSGGLSGSTEYTVSAYVKFNPNSTSTDRTISLYVQENDGGGTFHDTDYTIDITGNDHVDRWFRISHTFTTNAGTTDLTTLSVRLNSGAEVGDVLYIDGLMIHTGSVPRAWTTGATTRSNGLLRIDTDWLRYNVKGITMACWVNPYQFSAGVDQVMLLVGDTSTGFRIALQKSSGDVWAARLISTSTTIITFTVQAGTAGTTPATAADGWTHVAGTYDLENLATKIFVNGTLAHSSSAVAATSGMRRRLVSFADNSSHQIGISNLLTAANWAPGPMADVLIIPEIMSATQIAALAAFTDDSYGLGALPLYVSGDALGSAARGVRCLGTATRRVQPVAIDGAWDNNAAQLQIELQEVPEQ